MQGPANWDNPELARDIERDDDIPADEPRVSVRLVILAITITTLVIAFCVVKATT